MIPRLSFLEKRRKHPFVHFPIDFLFMGSVTLSEKNIKCSCLLNFWGGLAVVLCFSFLILFNPASGSYFVNCFSFMFRWPFVIFSIGFSVTKVGFPIRFLECSFSCYLLSWLSAFNFAIEVLSFWHTSFTIFTIVYFLPNF